MLKIQKRIEKVEAKKKLKVTIKKQKSKKQVKFQSVFL